MNKTTRRLWIPLLVALVLAPFAPVAAASPAETLEKAIYTEETLGDLPAAIVLYRQIVEAASSNRRYTAEALLRLGQAESKNGNKPAATQAFRQLIDEFPQQEKLVAQARELMPEQVEELVLGRAPWEDGERLRYEMRLPAGMQIGAMVSTVQSATVDGEEAWHIELRRLVVAGKNVQVLSHVDVARDDSRPLSSRFKHPMMGEFRSAYAGDHVRHEAIGAGGEVQGREIPLEGIVYDNEQALHLMRQLPLAEGFKTSLTVLPFHGQLLPIEAEVTAIETVEVPAGSFEAYRFEMSIGQVYWISTAPGQHVVKFEAEGMRVELTEIGKVASDGPTDLTLSGFGHALKLPSGWNSFEVDTHDASSSAVALFDPAAETASTLELDRARGQTLEGRVERELDGCKKRFVDYALRENSMQARKIAGLPARSFVGDYKDGNKSMVQYRIYVVGDEFAAEFIFKTPADRFDDLRESFDTIVESYRAG